MERKRAQQNMDVCLLLLTLAILGHAHALLAPARAS